MARKILTIGITINLENYENLRLEVQGEIGAGGDTEELVAFLDGMLARLGHGDEATGELVDAYRRRVLAQPGTGGAPAAAARPSPARKGGEGQAAQPPVQGEAPRQAPGPAAEPVQKPREPRQPAEAPQEGQAPRDEKPATVRVSTESRAAKPAARMAAQPGGAAPPAQAPQPPREAPGEPAPKAEKPKLAEGEVACEGCGVAITKNQEKLSKLLTGKSLCKRCMNP
jgi:hypothetical protein